jgi:hypothetical protein
MASCVQKAAVGQGGGRGEPACSAAARTRRDKPGIPVVKVSRMT